MWVFPIVGFIAAHIETVRRYLARDRLVGRVGEVGSGNHRARCMRLLARAFPQRELEIFKLA
jgi:hypothetical protein